MNHENVTSTNLPTLTIASNETKVFNGDLLQTFDPRVVSSPTVVLRVSSLVSVFELSPRPHADALDGSTADLSAVSLADAVLHRVGRGVCDGGAGVPGFGIVPLGRVRLLATRVPGRVLFSYSSLSEAIDFCLDLVPFFCKY